MWKRLSLIRQWRRRLGTEINRRIEGASQVGCKVIEMHPTRTATGPIRKHPRNPTTHPTLMFHYRVLAVWEGSLLPVVVAICCTLFTNCCTPLWAARKVADCSQSVHKLLHTAQKLIMSVPTDPGHCLCIRGSNSGDVNEHNSTTPPKKSKIGPSSLAFPSIGPARYQDRAGDLGLGRD